MFKKNQIKKIINETIIDIVNEVFDPNGGNLYQPKGLDPKVVRLFENIDNFYQRTLNDDYWTDVNIKNFPKYNSPNSEDNKKAIDYIINKMKNKYPDENWIQIEKPLRMKILDNIT